MRTALRRTATLGLALGLTFGGVAACGDDDGADVRELDGSDGSGSSGSSSGSGSGSSSGVADTGSGSGSEAETDTSETTEAGDEAENTESD